MAGGRGVGQEYTDLAVIGRVCRAGVHSGDAGRFLTLLQESSFVNDKYCILFVADRIDDHGPQVIARSILVPLARVEEALHSVRSLVTGSFGYGPSILSLQL